MTDRVKTKLAELPAEPGIYLFRSKSDEIIYIGKAAKLRSRVRQYFQASRLRDTKTDALVAEIHDLEWIQTDSEIDALFLESEMVKRYMPRYNVLLRDDKSETFVRIDINNPWPTVTLTRNPVDDGAEYIGPFYNAYPVRKALRYLRRAFPYYTKTPKQTDSRLEQQIGLVPNRSDENAMQAYRSNLRQLMRYIKGERKALVRQLEADMKRSARQQNFEEAARLRNQLRHMNELQQKVMFGDSEYRDIVKDIALEDLGKILGIDQPLRRIECIDVSHHGGSDAVAVMVVFVNGVSSRSDYRKFRLSDRNDDYASIKAVVERRFSVNNLQKWPAPQLLIIDGGKGQLSAALSAMESRQVSVPVIGLAKNNETIILKQSMLSADFTNFEPDSTVTIERDGDYCMINLEPHKIKSSGHARNLRGHQAAARYNEVVKLLQRIRDESHRFAVSYHHTVQSRSVGSGRLLAIPGVGPATQRKLLKAFGSAKGVSMASEAELAVVVGLQKARDIRRGLGA